MASPRSFASHGMPPFPAGSNHRALLRRQVLVGCRSHEELDDLGRIPARLGFEQARRGRGGIEDELGLDPGPEVVLDPGPPEVAAEPAPGFEVRPAIPRPPRPRLVRRAGDREELPSAGRDVELLPGPDQDRFQVVEVVVSAMVEEQAARWFAGFGRYLM
jgi:hypothetical protein